jgi:hypothetical protein
MSAPCSACREGRCEDCRRLGLGCDCCTDTEGLQELHDELEFASMHEEGLA